MDLRSAFPRRYGQDHGEHSRVSEHTPSRLASNANEERRSDLVYASGPHLFPREKSGFYPESDWGN